jgi:flagellar assembly protein FliH
MIARAAFSPRALGQTAQGFTPMSGLVVAQTGFVQHGPQHLVRQVVSEYTPEPEPERAPEPAPAPALAAPPVAMAKTVILSDQLRAQILAEGHAKGRAEALAELAPHTAALDQAAFMLRQMLDQISVAIDAETESLAQNLGQMVRSLASERAGSQIDHDPASFAARITTLAQRISDGFAGVMVMVNPFDLEALRAADTQGALPLAQLAQAELHADPSLARGDVRLRMAGLVLEDLIHSATGAA